VTTPSRDEERRDAAFARVYRLLVSRSFIQRSASFVFLLLSRLDRSRSLSRGQNFLLSRRFSVHPSTSHVLHSTRLPTSSSSSLRRLDAVARPRRLLRQRQPHPHDERERVRDRDDQNPHPERAHLAVHARPVAPSHYFFRARFNVARARPRPPLGRRPLAAASAFARSSSRARVSRAEVARPRASRAACAALIGRSDEDAKSWRRSKLPRAA